MSVRRSLSLPLYDERTFSNDIERRAVSQQYHFVIKRKLKISSATKLTSKTTGTIICTLCDFHNLRKANDSTTVAAVELKTAKPPRRRTNHLVLLSLAIPPWVGTMSTSERWGVNRHIA